MIELESFELILSPNLIGERKTSIEFSHQEIEFRYDASKLRRAQEQTRSVNQPEILEPQNSYFIDQCKSTLNFKSMTLNKPMR